MHKCLQKKVPVGTNILTRPTDRKHTFFKGGPNAQGKEGNDKKKSCQSKHRENTRNLIFSSFYFLDSMMRDIVIFAVKYFYISKSVLHMQFSQISKIGIGKISSWTGNSQDGVWPMHSYTYSSNVTLD